MNAHVDLTKMSKHEIAQQIKKQLSDADETADGNEKLLEFLEFTFNKVMAVAAEQGQFVAFNNKAPKFKYRYVPYPENDDMVMFRADPLNETASEMVSLFDDEV